MPKTPSTSAASEAASILGKRSAAARRKKWGEKEFKKKMREWGKLGGRPRKKGGKTVKKKRNEFNEQDEVEGKRATKKTKGDQ